MEASQFGEEHRAPVGASAELVDSDFELPPRTPGQLFRTRFREDRIAMASLIFIGLLILMAVFAPAVVSLVGAPDPDYRDTGALDRTLNAKKYILPGLGAFGDRLYGT